MSESERAAIEERLRSFIQFRSGRDENSVSIKKLRGDASIRQYFRFSADGESTILTLYPASFDPHRFPYLEVYRLFRELQIPVPQVLTIDGDLGIIEQEDLGDETLRDVFPSLDSQERRVWLRKAIDSLVRLQTKAPEALDPDAEYSSLAFDSEKLNWELGYFQRNFLGEYCGMGSGNEERLLEEFEQIAREMASYPRVLCHRDYHYRNLMPKGGTLYVIDFQDARWGPSSYDLAALLQDSISLAPQFRDELINYFLASRPELEIETFANEMRVVTVQRLLKALGTFGYQIRIRGLKQYEELIPGTLARVREVLEELPGFETIQAVVERAVESCSRRHVRSRQ